MTDEYGGINWPNLCVQNTFQHYQETNLISDRHSCRRPTISIRPYLNTFGYKKITFSNY